MLILTDDQKVQFLSYLKTKLAEGVSTIVFTKADGSERVLKGTRDKDIIGEELYEAYINPPPKADGKPRKTSITSLPTFDTEIKQWRSFSLDKLVSVDGINTNELLKLAQIELA